MLFFADTYALIEFFKGNQSYKKKFFDNEIITTRLNLMELYYGKLADGTPELAEEYFNTLLPKTVEIEDEILKTAAKFRLAHKKQNISYIDAIGYEISNKIKIKFLTGDKEFKDMPNVEFVK